MEEKERYDRHSYYPQRYIDNETNKDTLNQQDKRIKELEKENQQLKEQLSLKMEELHIAYCSIENVKTKNGELKAEIKTLKQSQKQLAIEELEFVLKNFRNRPAYFDVAKQELCLSDQDKQFIDFISSRIKELKGEG